MTYEDALFNTLAMIGTNDVLEYIARHIGIETRDGKDITFLLWLFAFFSISMLVIWCLFVRELIRRGKSQSQWRLSNGIEPKQKMDK